MKHFSDNSARWLEKVLDSGVRPGMSIEDENAVNKANLFYLLACILALIIAGEALRMGSFSFLPIPLAILSGSLVCFAVVARTGRPRIPSLLFLCGLSIYILARISMGGERNTGYILVMIFPFLYFAALSFKAAALLFLLLLAGLVSIFFLFGEPQYPLILRQRIVLLCAFSGCAAMLGEFIRWRAQQKISLLMTELTAASRTDSLTGLRNRKGFEELFQYEITRSVRESLSLSLIMLDLDHFKHLNDTYGHGCGDAALRHVADVIRSTLRKQDTAARWGGEEFFLLLPGTPLAGALVLAEKLRILFEGAPCLCGSVSVNFTASLGVHEYNHAESPEENIRRADALLYEAKRLGRNQVRGETTASGS